MLGVGPAVMALALLESARESFELWGIDNSNFTGLCHLDSAGFNGRMIAKPALSWVASDGFKDNSVDLLFVDASHDFDSVCKDIESWYPKVKDGGIMFFHDYVPLEEGNGVEAAIEKYINPSWEEISRPGVSIVFKKSLK